MKNPFRYRHGLALIALLAGPALAQDDKVVTTTTTHTTQQTVATPGGTTTTTTTKGKTETRDAAGRIVTQPVRDLGVQRVDIPVPVQQAAAAPYSLRGLKTCAQLNAAIFQLNDVLGPDYAGTVTRKENRAGKLAEAGGKTVVNTIIPFRGLVREITGAAPAERRLNAAIQAAFARRGFLRGSRPGGVASCADVRSC